MPDDPVIDQPLGGLPLGERVLYQDARLDLVVLEVRFSSTADHVTDHQAQEFHAALQQSGMNFEQVVQATQREFRVDISSTDQEASLSETAGWQFRASGNGSVVLWPHSVAIQTGREYQRWSVSLRPVLEAALDGIQAVFDPALVQRIGLRYINRLPHRPDDKNAWEGRIVPSLLGPMRHEVLGSRIRSSQQQLEIFLEEGRGAVVRHGTQPGESGLSDYLLDIDVFDLTASRFSTADTLVMAQRLNRTAMALFQQCVTEKLLTEMRPLPTEDGKTE